MKTVWIIGIGMGADTVTKEGLQAVESAQLLIGSGRTLYCFAGYNKPVIREYEPLKVAAAVRQSDAEWFAVLVSGDVGFYSAAEGLTAALDFCDVKLIPGVSSVSCFFARLKLPWQNAALISCHGRSQNLVDTVRRNRFTFALTGGNIPELADELTSAGFGALNAWVGENLGMKTERIISCEVSKLGEYDIGNLAVLLTENPVFDDSTPFGIPDERFIRGEVPMTKAEVRAVIMSKLRLSPDSVCADIGAGTGSVTVEMALCAYRGRVYAIDKNPEAIELINRNAKAFHLGNVVPVLGEAADEIAKIPPCDAVFIGGSGKRMSEIVSAVLAKNPAARIVISAIAIESVNAATEALCSAGLESEIVQVGISRARTAGGLHLLTAQNPIFVISGGGKQNG